MKDEDIRKRLKVIQGGKPNVRYMKNKLPGQFKELKMRLNEVKNLRWQPLEDVMKIVEEYETEYGIHLEGIYFEETEMVDKVYESINYKLLPRVQEAKRIQENQEKREKYRERTRRIN